MSPRHQVLCGIPARKDESIRLTIKAWKATLPENEQTEADELHNLLYTLHTIPVIDQIGISIAKCTTEDPLLCKLLEIIKSGKT